jgi:hypothetical protein
MEFFAKISEQSGLSRVYTYLSSISYHYRRVGRPSPCDDQRVKMFMKGLKRVDSVKPTRRARPLTLQMLQQMIQLLETDDSLLTWRTVWRAVITFTTFLRWDDVKRLKVFDLIENCS